MKFLIISYFFPPNAVGAATVMYNLCKHLPHESYSVITTQSELSIGLGVYDREYVLDCNAVRLPVYRRTRFDDFKFSLLTVFKGLSLNKKERFNCFLAVYPNIHNLLGAYVLHKLTRKPFVVYMHDLFSENLFSLSKLRRKFWGSIERKILEAASKILVMNENFRDHYSKKGISNVTILPPSIDLSKSNCDTISSKARFPRKNSRIVFTGSVHPPQENAVLAFLKATETMSDVKVLFATPSKKEYLKAVFVGFLSKKECIELQKSADVLFLPLYSNSPISGELKCAFPCKLLEYLAAGKPILAVVPKGSFVESFVKKHEVGIAVIELSIEKIAEAIEKIKDKENWKRYSRNALKTVSMFDAKKQSKRLFSILEDMISRDQSLKNSTNN